MLAMTPKLNPPREDDGLIKALQLGTATLVSGSGAFQAPIEMLRVIELNKEALLDYWFSRTFAKEFPDAIRSI